MDEQIRSSFDNDNRKSDYRKSLSFEQFLTSLNNALEDVEAYVHSILTNRSYPVFLVIGLPRSGTTFLTQLLASQFSVGYVSNLMARFYRTPCVGAFLQQELIGGRISQLSEFHSVHGVTKLIEEPHEYGYFWSRFLVGSEDSHEPDDKTNFSIKLKNKLMDELENITKVFGKPFVLKCTLAAFHFNFLASIPFIKFIYIKRNVAAVKRSILKVRHERLENPNQWWSLQPKNYKSWLNLRPEEQVKRQISYALKCLSEYLKLSPERLITVNYESLVKNTDNELIRIKQFLY